MEEKIYYEKILVSSGEVPEEEGWYITDKGVLKYDIGYKQWEYLQPVPQSIDPEIDYWLKPVPSPKQEAVEIIELKNKIQKLEDENSLLRQRVEGHYDDDGNFLY